MEINSFQPTTNCLRIYANNDLTYTNGILYDLDPFFGPGWTDMNNIDLLFEVRQNVVTAVPKWVDLH